MAAVAFVNGRILIHKYLPASSGFMAGNDFDMFGQGCLGIGNHGRRKKCHGYGDSRNRLPGRYGKEAFHPEL